MSEKVGIEASEGATYEIRSGALFQEADYARKLVGNGEKIMIYDPKVDYSSPPIWENGRDPSKEETAIVPAGCRVTVIAAPGIGAAVTFTRE